MNFSVLSPPPVQRGDQLRWGRLLKGSDALAVATMRRREAGLCVVLCSDSAAAERWEYELGFFLGDNASVWRLPDWETLPYDRFSPHQDLVSDRLLAFSRLVQGGDGVLVVPAATLMQRVAPPEFVARTVLVLEPGQKQDVDALRQQLLRAGYRAVDTVYEHGEFALRGSILDIFPMGLEWPVRIEFFDQEIESLRHFDPESQRSHDRLPALRLLPGREFPFDAEAVENFRARWHARFDNDHRLCPDYREVCRGIAPGGIEYYLPLFFEHCATLFDYLPAHSLLFVEEPLTQQLERVWNGIRERHHSLDGDITRPLLRPAELFLSPDEVRSRLKQFTRVTMSATEQQQRAGAANASADALGGANDAAGVSADTVERIAELLRAGHERLLFCAESPGRREILLETLRRAGAEPLVVDGWQDFLAVADRCCLAVAALDDAFTLGSPSVALVAESALFGRRVLQRRRRSRGGESHETVIRNLSELSAGVPVVHIEHGIGRYQGLQTLELDDQVAEFLAIEYAEGARLLVPVTSLQTISRYSGADVEQVQLHRLGGDQWQRAKRRAAEKIRDVAAELLAIHARRESRPGFAFTHPGVDYERFAASFPFEETADQAAAIDAVIADMCAPRAMDRLVCGDVGFGKTEVAMRAAFVAAHNGKQVALLVPTTLLAQQHFETFRDRFAELPFTIESLSRFRSAAEQKGVIERTASGAVDILIGTHSLLQKSVRYRDLGLLIVDEEHRFGVRQKEQLKALRASVDILTLTATPIPRTLNMALAGMRDLSIISTPPARRLSVRTFVQRNEPGLVRDAIRRELQRGGQVFLLHNDIRSIDRRSQEIAALVPEGRTGVAHGQMRERELERAMSDFYHRRFDILLCSTIIETGIDIPSANTIIIERADKFGLAQLHQLRGRVGRSHHQAYAFLLTPEEQSMTADAVKRLAALEGTDSLGAGFLLATHDLEIRGAGELLGEDQSGQIEAIGYSLYMELLSRAVNAMKAGRLADSELAFEPATEISLRVSALIPEDYLPDVHNRLILYKRIASATTEDTLYALEVEMIDRFGLLPQQVRNLFRIARIRLTCETLGIRKLEASTRGGVLEFAAETRVEPLTVVKLVQQDASRFRLDGGTRLRFARELEQPEQRFVFVESLLERLGTRAAHTKGER